VHIIDRETLEGCAMADMTDTEDDQGSARLPRRSRPVRVADAIKELMIEKGMVAGDRLPNEAEMIETFGMSKGTIREAMRILEAQGLVETKTGPGGGSFIKQVSHERARALLGNYFYFKDLSIADIYQLRFMLEPELAASLAGKLPAHAIEKLEQDIARYSSPANTLEEERDHHVNSLRFHMRLAHYADNVLLGFLIDFMASILSDITVSRHLYDPPNIALWRKGIECQRQLVAALRDGDSEKARAVMSEHMTNAQRLMQNQEDYVLKNFMSDS
jgi:DNA-binding FadR family transcriptional regulator